MHPDWTAERPEEGGREGERDAGPGGVLTNTLSNLLLRCGQKRGKSGAW